MAEARIDNTVRIVPRSRMDALAYSGKVVVICGTRGPHSGFIHKSRDYGATWRSIGNVGTGVANHWLDHVIYINDGTVRVVVGGTNQGFILYSVLPSP